MYLSSGERASLRQDEEYTKTKERIDRLSMVLNVHGDVANIYPSRYAQFEEMFPDAFRKLNESREISSILRAVKSQVDYENARVKSMNQMLGYLGLVESLGVSFADIILMLAIASGNDLHTRGSYTKHVSSFKELEDLDLNQKLDFLVKVLGLRIFETMIDRSVRNIIAHLKFKIESDGKIIDRGNNQVLIEEKIRGFWKSVDILELAFDDLHLWERLEPLTHTGTGENPNGN
jgi:hypothetical protein